MVVEDVEDVEALDVVVGFRDSSRAGSKKAEASM